MAASFMKWTKEQLFSSLLGRYNEKLLSYFVDLPGSFSLKGFFDGAELKNVYLDTAKLSTELFQAGIPVRITYGYIGTLKLNLYFTQSKSHIIVEDLIILLGPHLGSTNYGSVIESNLEVIKRHIIDAINQLTLQDFLLTQTSSDKGHLNDQGSTKTGLNGPHWEDIATWLFRYDPNLSISIRNIHIRYEDNTFVSPFSLGLVLDTIYIRPSSKFWSFEWPFEHQGTPTFSLGYDSQQSYIETSPDPSDTLSSSSHPPDHVTCPMIGSHVPTHTKDHSLDNIQSVKIGRSIFIGVCKRMGLYCNHSIPTSWIPPKYKDMIDGPRGIIYKLVSYKHILNLSATELKTHHWMIEPYDFTFQFGLHSKDCLKNHTTMIKQSTHDLNEPWEGGGRCLFRFTNPIRLSIDKTIIMTFIELSHTIKQFNRKKELLSYKILPKDSQHYSTDMNGRRCIARDRWEYCRQYIRLLRKEHTVSSLKKEIDYRVDFKRQFISFIRLWLLEYHFQHSKGYVHTTSAYPLIDRPFRLLSSDFILGNPYYHSVNQKDIHYVQQQQKQQHSINAKPILLSLTKPFVTGQPNTRLICCSEKDFEEISLTICPLAYFFLIPIGTLRKLSIGNPQVQFLMKLMYTRNPYSIAQWYLIAVRETEEILRLSRHCFIGRDNNYLSNKKTSHLNASQELLQETDHDPHIHYLEGLSISLLSYFLERDTTFFSAIRHAFTVHHPMKRTTLFQKIRMSPLWRRGLLKLDITADFYDAYISKFPGIHCEHIDLRAMFALKSQSTTTFGSTSPMSLASVILDSSQATPAKRIIPSIYFSPLNSLHKQPNRVIDNDLSDTTTHHQEIPWNHLLSDHSQSDPFLRYTINDAELTFPRFLWNMTFGVLFSDIQLSINTYTTPHFQETHDVHSIQQQNIIGIRFILCGFEFECHRKLLFNAVCKHVDIITFEPSNHGGDSTHLTTVLDQTIVPIMTLSTSDFTRFLKTTASTPQSTKCQPMTITQQPSNMFDTGPVYPSVYKSSTLSYSIPGDTELCYPDVSDSDNESVSHPDTQQCNHVDTHLHHVWDNFIDQETNSHHSLESNDIIQDHLNLNTSFHPSTQSDSSSNVTHVPSYESSHLWDIQTLPSSTVQTTSHDTTGHKKKFNLKWGSFLSVNCLTRSMAQRLYRLEFPIFLDLTINIADIHLFIRPKLIDHCRYCLLDIYQSCYKHHRRYKTEFGLLDWTGGHKHTGMSSIQYRSVFYTTLLTQYFPNKETFKDPTGFWKERLHIVCDSDLNPEDNETQLTRVSNHRENSHKQFQFETKLKPFIYYPLIPSISDHVFCHSLLDKSHMTVNFYFPKITTLIFSANDTVTTTDDLLSQTNHFIEVVIMPDHVYITTLRKKGQLHLFAKSTMFSIITKQTIQQCLALWTTLKRIIYQRHAELYHILHTLQEFSETSFSTLPKHPETDMLYDSLNDYQRCLSIYLSCVTLNQTSSLDILHQQSLPLDTADISNQLKVSHTSLDSIKESFYLPFKKISPFPSLTTTINDHVSQNNLKQHATYQDTVSETLQDCQSKKNTTPSISDPYKMIETTQSNVQDPLYTQHLWKTYQPSQSYVNQYHQQHNEQLHLIQPSLYSSTVPYHSYPSQQSSIQSYMTPQSNHMMIYPMQQQQLRSVTHHDPRLYPNRININSISHPLRPYQRRGCLKETTTSMYGINQLTIWDTFTTRVELCV